MGRPRKAPADKARWEYVQLRMTTEQKKHIEAIKRHVAGDHLSMTAYAIEVLSGQIEIPEDI